MHNQNSQSDATKKKVKRFEGYTITIAAIGASLIGTMTAIHAQTAPTNFTTLFGFIFTLTSIACLTTIFAIHTMTRDTPVIANIKPVSFGITDLMTLFSLFYTTGTAAYTIYHMILLAV